MSARDRAEKLQHLARAWDAGAGDYDAYFVPRFAAWADDAVRAVDRPLPDGPIRVPCCGTGPELVRLARRHAGRTIVGVDLSSGMAERARAAVRSFPHVRVDVADASDASEWGACAAIVSVFGLQQMPEPALAMSAWALALAPGAVLSVIYWPEIVEELGPFAWLREALAGAVPADSTWEAKLGPAIRDAGCEIVADDLVGHPMSHADPDTFWRACLESGFGRALASRGDDFLRDARARFDRLATPGPVEHRPRARHIVARR